MNIPIKDRFLLTDASTGRPVELQYLVADCFARQLLQVLANQCLEQGLDGETKLLSAESYLADRQKFATQRRKRR